MHNPRLLGLHALGQAARARSAFEFELAAQDVEATQRRHLQNLLRQNRETEWGRRFGFSELKTPQAYSQRLPLMTPAELAPVALRLMQGERSIVTQEAPIYYVRTTGSTGAFKHVPITPSYRREFQKTVHVGLWNLFLRFPAAFTGRALYFVGSARVAQAKDGNDIGTMSGFNFTQMPKLVRALYAWPSALFEVSELRTRTFLSLLFACQGEPTLIAGIFPSAIVYLLRELGPLAPELTRTFRSGRLPAWLTLRPEQRSAFEFALRASSRLAERLERVAHAPEEEKAGEAFPSLRLVYCWVTATAALYVPELQWRLGPSVAVRDAIYSACEGWCSIPMGDPEPGGALAITSHFFEFFEVAAYDEGRVEPRYAWELEDRQRYYIAFTTAAGLYRYLLGDIIEVCGTYGAVPRIRFVRKAGAASNLAGEKLEEVHVNEAVGGALSALGLRATYFTLAPVLGTDRPGYRLYLELGAEAPAQLTETLRSEVDRRLGEASYDYGRLRAGNQLAAVSLSKLPPGTYQRFRQRRVSEGSAEAQLKTAHLLADASSMPPELLGE